MALGNKCWKSYMELILKRGSVKMHLHGKKRFLSNHVLQLMFFFARQCRPLIKQIIFQNNCFNDKLTYPMSRSHEI